MDVTSIETERTVGRRVQLEDLGLLYRMYTNDEVMYSLGGIRTFSESKMFVGKMVNDWETLHFGVYMFFDKNTNDFIGRCGVRKKTIDNKEENELLYALMPAYWGKGYATEISKKLIQVAFDNLQMTDLVAYTSATNKKSQDVILRLGFTFEKNFKEGTDNCIFYRIKRQ